jgi:NADH-quinone oxidoreductase subunit C
MPDTDTAATDGVDTHAGDEVAALLGGMALATQAQAGDVWVRVPAASWRDAAQALRDAGYEYFCFLSGIDWMPAAPDAESAASVEQDAGADEAPDAEAAAEAEQERDESADPAGTVGPARTGAANDVDGGWETGVTGGDSRFQVLLRVYSTARHEGVFVKADLDDDDPRVPSIVPVFAGAEWHERETWEMFGFGFDGHPGLRHIYLPAEFEGHPLRKDFPLLAREVKPWPGLVDVEPMPGDDDAAGSEASE